MQRISGLLFALALASCGGDTTSDAGSGLDAGAGLDAAMPDSGMPDAGMPDAATLDAATSDAGAADASVPMDAGADAGGPSCLDAGLTVGERVPVGDHCNFCECQADGSSVCTARACGGETSSCDYAGVMHEYGEEFPSTDECNVCVCAASGLACTRRPACAPSDEGAILLESMTEACGTNPAFTGAAVLAGLPIDDVTVAFPYERGGLYPESLADTRLRVRVVYEGGFIVCRIPMPTQPAIDMEVVVEWMTEDGAFDEGMHTYLRRNDFGFLDAWETVASAPVGGLDGTYTPTCFDPGGFGFAALFYADGTVEGSISKVCESDLYLDIGRFLYAP